MILKENEKTVSNEALNLCYGRLHNGLSFPLEIVTVPEPTISKAGKLTFSLSPPSLK